MSATKPIAPGNRTLRCTLEEQQQLAAKIGRLEAPASVDSTIQGYANGIFWERNAAARLAKNRTQTA